MPRALWKTLVDNSVENVENYEFSTAILLFAVAVPLGKTMNEAVHNRHSRAALVYVTATGAK